MIPPDDTSHLPQWKPALYHGRWHIFRKHPNGDERSIESFGNRSTALVVAETLNGAERLEWRRLMRLSE